MIRVFLVGVVFVIGSIAWADDVPRPMSDPRLPGSVQAPIGLPPSLAELVIQPKLGDQVPADLEFADESGKRVKIGDYLNSNKPIILVLAYLRCPNLCDQTINSLLDRLRPEKFPLMAGKDFTILTVSFDHREKPDLASAKKDSYVKSYGRPGVASGWHFLTGEESQIKQLADSVGFRFRWDNDKNLYSHASGIMVLSPQGKVTHYFMGMVYYGRDLELALVESSGGKIGTLGHQIALFCFPYDGVTGRYTVPVLTWIRWCSVLTVVILLVSIVRAVRQPSSDPVKVPTTE